MRNYYYLMTGFFCLIHFWRFPHLVMENGGGAFVITYLILLFTISLPLFIAEVAFGKIFAYPGKEQYTLYRERIRDRASLQVLTKIQWAIESLLLIGLFQYFAFIGCLAFGHWQRILWAAPGELAQPTVVQPALWPRFGLLLVFSLAVFVVNLPPWQRRLSRIAGWVIPFCLLTFVVVLTQILSIGTHIEGIKTLLYPDFTLLRGISLIEALGHALISTCAGLGFHRLSTPMMESQDPVSVSVQMAFISMIAALFSGLLALPMVEQISETAFGANWLFFILPRWLMYNQHGTYYCELFFVAIMILSVFLGSLITQVFVLQVRQGRRLVRLASFIFLNGFLAAGLVVLFFQKNWWGWWGQNTVLLIDRVFIDLLLPINGVAMVALLFFASNRHQREEIFAQQKVFYHSDYFYRIWRLSCRVLFPLVFFVGLVLAYIG